MKARCLLLLLVAFAGCGKPPLADLRYDFNGDVVGVMTLAQFKEKHAEKYSPVAANDFDKSRGAVVLTREHDKVTGEPSFGGQPARVRYTFMNDVLESIDLTLAEGADAREAAGPLQDAVVEKLGPWQRDRDGTLYWESRWSTAWYTTHERSLHLTDSKAMLAYNKAWDEYCEKAGPRPKNAQPVAKEAM